MSDERKRGGLGWAVIALLLVGGAAGTARADVRREGTWPAEDPKVSLSVRGRPRAEVVRRLAEEAGWSVVVRGLPGDAIDVHVEEQPASKVLDLVLADGRYVATRDGDLVSIAPSAAEEPAERGGPAGGPAPVPAASAAVAPAVSAASVASAGNADEAEAEGDQAEDEAAGEDRVVTGGSVHVEKGEVVHDLVVLGGSADVEGTVTGDLAVLGGSARIHPGAEVRGDATALGGSLTVDDGARVGGDVAVLGGRLVRGDEARIGGRVHRAAGSRGKKGGGDDDEEKTTMSSLMHDAGAAMTRTAMLFVFGAILLALATRKMDRLELAVAAKPMRSFALGVVCLLASIVAVVVLCVTIVGIPVALLGVLVGVLAAYVGICAVLTTAGGALLRHRTENPYVHLAAGCLVYLLVGAIPYVGGLVTFVVVMLGIGAVVATRGAGLVPPKNGAAAGYQTVEEY